uniref:Uncharacterized protein n=1 Tax=Knipowitschia caucasica TaxID=637954 RepID=A0AAV2JWT5_KNICA
MAKAKCQKCGVDVPLQLLQDHINSCAVIEIDFDPTDEDPSHPDEEKLQPCPVCLKIFPTELIERHASSCGESSVSPQSAIAPNEEFAAIPGPSKVSTVYEGRMMGHSFLHGGPCLSGLSPAIVHVLLGGTPETSTVTLEDCPDLDICDTIKLVLLQRIIWPKADDDDDDNDECSVEIKTGVFGYLREFITKATSKGIQVFLEPRQKHVVAAEEMSNTANAEEAFLFKIMENIIVNTCYSHPQISPQSLYPKM